MCLSAAVDRSASATRPVGTRSRRIQIAAVKTPVTTAIITDFVLEVRLWAVIIFNTYS